MTTATASKNIYEGLFLFPHGVTSNLQGAADHVHSLLDRAEADVISFKKWDERRLAYEIKGNKRGVYFLAYFKAPAENMTGLERDCNLSDQLLRAMFLRADHVPTEMVEAAEGRDALADEIKLRTEQGESAKGDAPAAVVKTGPVEPEPAPAAAEAPAEASAEAPADDAAAKPAE